MKPRPLNAELHSFFVDSVSECSGAFSGEPSGGNLLRVITGQPVRRFGGRVLTPWIPGPFFPGPVGKVSNQRLGGSNGYFLRLFHSLLSLSWGSLRLGVNSWARIAFDADGLSGLSADWFIIANADVSRADGIDCWHMSAKNRRLVRHEEVQGSSLLSVVVAGASPVARKYSASAGHHIAGEVSVGQLLQIDVALASDLGISTVPDCVEFLGLATT